MYKPNHTTVLADKPHAYCEMLEIKSGTVQ
jgi:hypothetical protein